MSKVGMWLVMLLAVLFLAKPQGAVPTETLSETQYSVSACVKAEEETDNTAEIIIFIIILFKQSGLPRRSTRQGRQSRLLLSGRF